MRYVGPVLRFPRNLVFNGCRTIEVIMYGKARKIPKPPDTTTFKE
jgi:hypothetical protein